MGLYKYRIRCSTENDYVYTWEEVVPTVCPNNNSHTIDGNLTTIINSISELINTGSGLTSASGFNSSLFGDGTTVQYTPVIQNYTPYGIINNQMYSQFSATGGSITAHENGIETKLTTSNSVGSYAVLRSKKVLKFRPGLTNVYRGSTRFDTPVSLSLQFIGVGNNGSDLYFAYTGVTFGIRISTNGISEIRKLTITNQASSNQDVTVSIDSISYVIPVTNSNGTSNFTTHQISIGNAYSGWLVEQVNNTLFFIGKQVGPRNGTYSFNSTGDATATWTTVKTGSALTTTTIPQNTWNGPSKMVQNLDPLKNNLYEIEYAWFGSSNITFKVCNPDSGEFELVHTLTFANTHSTPSLSQPNLFIQEGVASLGTTTPLTLTTTCSFGATMGPINVNTPLYSISFQKSIKGTESVLLSIKNRHHFNCFINHGEMILKKFTLAIDGSKPVKIKLYKNPTTLSNNSIADYINYTYIDENNSLGLYNINSDTFTGGTLIDTFYIGKDGGIIITDDIKLYQFDTLIFTASSRNTNDINISISIIDDF
jgi:hypothetical protein